MDLGSFATLPKIATEEPTNELGSFSTLPKLETKQPTTVPEAAIAGQIEAPAGALYRGETGRAVAAAMTQGAIEAGQDILSLAADINSVLGINREGNAATKRGFAAQRKAYGEIEEVKNSPIASTIAKDTAKSTLELLPAAKVGAMAERGVQLAEKSLGLGRGLLPGYKSVSSGVANDFTTGATIGALQGGQGEDPWLSRLQSAGVNAISFGAMGGISRGIQAAIRGPATLENINAQQAMDILYKQYDMKAPVSHITQSTTLDNTMMGLSQLPGIGGKGKLLGLKAQLEQANGKFMDSMSVGTKMADATVDKIHQAVKASPTGSVSLVPAHKMASAVLRQLDGMGDVSNPAINTVRKKAQEVLSSNNLSFKAARSARIALDDAVSQVIKARNMGQVSGQVEKAAVMLRKAVEFSNEKAANAVGMGTEYAAAKNLYKQNIGYNKIKELWDNAGGLALAKEGGDIAKTLEPKNLVNFTNNLKEQAKDIMPLLTPENKQVFKGLLTLNSNMKNVLQKIKPGVGLMNTSLAGGMGVTAASIAGLPKTVAIGAAIKGVSHLLNSDAGRDLLTYVGRATPSIAQRLTQRILQGTSNAIINKFVNPPQDEE